MGSEITAADAASEEIQGQLDQVNREYGELSYTLRAQEHQRAPLERRHQELETEITRLRTAKAKQPAKAKVAENEQETETP